MNKKETGADDAQDFSGMPAAASVGPADIQQKEFRVSRFGGYRMRDVDEFLDQVTEAMTKLSDENQRLRSATGLPVAPVPLPMGAPDLEDTARQADEIIQRARAEAAVILQDARQQAAGSAAGSATDEGRAAVAAFLSQEKDFLQQLASLVQGHAESVKGMARASRSAAKSGAPASEPAAQPGAVAAQPGAAVAATPAEPAKASGSQEPPRGDETTKPIQVRAPVSDPRPAEPIRIEEPATASISAGEGDDEGSQADGDRTLRELFWGEE
jgi:DivIVA domain-containing protein